MNPAIRYDEQTLIRSLLQLWVEVRDAAWARLDAAAREDQAGHQRAYERQHEAQRQAAQLRQWLREVRAEATA